MIPAPRMHVNDTASIKAEPGKGCPRCGGVVFAAEEVLAKGRVSATGVLVLKECADCNFNLSNTLFG